MTNNTELDEILEQHREWMRGIRTDRLVGTSNEQTKQGLWSLCIAQFGKQVYGNVFKTEQEARDSVDDVIANLTKQEE